MSLLNPTRKEMVQKRSSAVELIAQKLGSNYFSEINGFIQSFQIEEEEERSKGNYIIGKKDRHYYCLLEYYHRGNKYEFDNYNSQAIIKLIDKDYPSFHLLTKKSVFFDILKTIFILVICLLIIVLIIYGKNYLPIINSPYYNKNYYFNTILLIMFLGLLFYVYFSELKGIIKHISQQKNYNINNIQFKEKYYIFSDSEPQKINEVFTEEVCFNIINSKTDLNFKIINNCITENFKEGEQLTFDSCKQHIESLISKVKLFEK